MRACRVCGDELFAEPLARYENMPGAAQGFPDPAAAAGDSGASLTVAQCTGCGLTQLTLEPVPYYREVIRAASVSNELKHAKRRQFADFVEKHALRGGKIIEIGCGRGEFLSLLDPEAVTPFGLEYSASSVAECAARGLRVARGYPGEGALEHAPFDAFLLLMFLEHMPDPRAALRAIHGSLRDGAVGLVEVPNFEMVLRERLFSEFIADHLLYFTRETLQTLLNLSGFDVLEFHTLRDDYVISATVRKRSRLDISAFRDAEASIRADIHRFLSGFPDRRVAIWGAGHQSLAIIALTGIAERIPFVVDSAPFKQGKVTPSTHVPVVAPAALTRANADAVLVIAGSYSDEVKALVRGRFGDSMKVAVLRASGLELS